MNQTLYVLIFFAVGYFSQYTDWLRYYAMLHSNDDFPGAYDEPQVDQYSPMIQTIPTSDIYAQQDASYPMARDHSYPFISPMDYGDFDDSPGTEVSSGEAYQDYFRDFFNRQNVNYGGWYGYDDDYPSYYDDYEPENQSTCTAECGVTSFQNSGNRMAGERVIGGDKAKSAMFPWVVRVGGGCTGGTVCGATIISPRLLASAFHCTVNNKRSRREPCDHSDGRRYAIVGSHDLRDGGLRVPITEVRHPPGAPFGEGRTQSHDFALMVLQQPLEWSDAVSPICLPAPDQEFTGVTAVAAGWGRYAPPDVSRTQSKVLRWVNLVVSAKRYSAHKMFGTILSKIGNKYMDVCSGDSGGPLMYRDPGTNKYVLIGTVTGFGYDCRKDTVKDVENSNNGLWNKVSHHITWIRQTAEEMGEELCS